MSNPPPRPALRKAPDADVHPALPPRPLSGVAAPSATPPATHAHPGAPSAVPAVPAVAPVAPAAPAAPEPARKRRRSTASDTLRPVAKAPKAGKPRDDATRKRSRDVAVPKKADKDKTVVVEVPMPKSLRRRLDARAEELGYSRDEAVLLLLRAWLDG